MKVIVCRECFCPLQCHERPQPYRCTVTFDGHTCSGFVPMMSDGKAPSAVTER